MAFRTGLIAARVSDGFVGNHSIWLMRGPIILEEVGGYSPDDWGELYAAYQAGDILYPWVAGPRSALSGDRGPWEI